MTIKLSLDKAALEALFPEGSDARVNLQRVVVDDLLKKLAIKDVKHVSEQLLKTLDPIIKGTVSEFVRARFGSSHSTAYYLTDAVKEAVKAEVRANMHSCVMDAVISCREEYQKAINEVKADPDFKLKLLNMLHSEAMDDVVTHALTRALPKLLSGGRG